MTDTITLHLFNWCYIGDHENCKREYQRFNTDPKTNKVVWLDEIVRCACKKRGCKCYTRPADRPAKKAVRKRRKK